MKYIFLLLSIIFLSGCTEQPAPQKTETTMPQTLVKDKKKIICPKVKQCEKCSQKIRDKSYKRPIIGQLENVYLPELKITLKSRIDTGATTTSIDAKNIVAFERDGKKWVRFDILDSNNKSITLKKKIEKSITVKRHQTQGQRRYVVKMRLNISNLSIYGNISLTDRSNYKFPILIGRNFLQGNAIVDVSLQYTKKPTKVEK
ncbi:MAG: RimK/LysX family protein [Sulfurimonas sp.]|nr:RimK/LysX family protein [Sulfurimonas sp.]